jgi:ribosomal protein S18 acetylase RimI-like enzyme
MAGRTDNRMPLVFEPLHSRHARASFCSGEPALDDWFRKRASQDQKRDLARVFVAIDRAQGEALVGFYSLSAFTLSLDSLPDKLARKLPRYDAIPASLIGRLARDQSVRGQGIGELLLADATKRVLLATESIAVYAIVVAAKNAPASAFYRSLGFLPFPDSPLRLFLLTETARAALAAAAK